MSTKAAAVVVLVCPQCGKKYKGDANKPDARYQCPIDQSTLIRLDTEAARAAKQSNSQPPEHSGQSDPGWNPAAAPGAAGFGSGSTPQGESSPYTEFISGGRPQQRGANAASGEMISDSAARPRPA